MGLRDEIESTYTDSDKLILEHPFIPPGPGTGNGIHNLAVYVILLHLSGKLTIEDVNSFTRTINTCRVNSYVGDYPPQPIDGLYNRGPRKLGELIAHDDYIALSAASSIIGTHHALDVALYGMNHAWSFNNLNPGHWTFQSWQGRRIWLPPFWRLCGGISASYFSREILASWIKSQRFEQDPSGRILSWLVCQAMDKRTAELSEAVTCWRMGLSLHFPEGMRSVFDAYYGVDHPFAKYAPFY